MRAAFACLVTASLLAGCTSTSRHGGSYPGPVAIVASPYEPAAQLDLRAQGSAAEGAVLGAAGGAGIGAMSAKASAGLLCTLGGPLCLIVMVPAAIVGGLVGGIAGGVADALTTDPGNRIAEARGIIAQAVADMRLTAAVAAQTRTHAAQSAAGVPAATLEVEMSELQIQAREKDMALVLQARARLYRAADGALLEEHVAQAQTDFRSYRDWAADDAQALRRAVDAAVAQLGARLAQQHRLSQASAY